MTSTLLKSFADRGLLHRSPPRPPRTIRCSSSGLERVRATALAINSADDERNPPDLGSVDREIGRVKNGRVPLIPETDDTNGHGTTFQAKYRKNDVAELLRTAPRLSE